MLPSTPLAPKAKGALEAGAAAITKALDTNKSK